MILDIWSRSQCYQMRWHHQLISSNSSSQTVGCSNPSICVCGSNRKVREWANNAIESSTAWTRSSLIWRSIMSARRLMPIRTFTFAIGTSVFARESPSRPSISSSIIFECILVRSRSLVRFPRVARFLPGLRISRFISVLTLVRFFSFYSIFVFCFCLLLFPTCLSTNLPNFNDNDSFFYAFFSYCCCCCLKIDEC